MNPRQHKQLLWSAAWVVVLGGLTLVLAGGTLDVSVHEEKPEGLRKLLATLATRPGAGGVPEKSRPDLAELMQVSGKELRRPLADPAATAVQNNSALTLQLVGTVMEPGHSVAMLRKADGNVEICACGQSVDDVGGPVVVREIGTDFVRVEYAGALRELRIPPEPAGAGGIEP